MMGNMEMIRAFENCLEWMREHDWTQRAVARNHRGHICNAKEKDAQEWCILGSMIASNPPGSHRVNAMFELSEWSRKWHGVGITDMNDEVGTTKGDMMEFLEEVINVLRKEAE